MTGFLSSYDNFMLRYQDTRTRDWFLVGKTGQLIAILAFYVYFCTKLGPRMMRDRKPFELKRTIQGYNLLQVFLNFYLVYQGIKCGWGTTYRFACEPVDYSDSPSALRMRSAVWLYFINKLVELLDTVFFILRKKYNQVTFLHLYHHTLMPVCAFIGVTFVPGGHGSLLGVINSFIHVVMYTYYFLSSFGPKIQKYLWWKKYVTRLQLETHQEPLLSNVTEAENNLQNFTPLFEEKSPFNTQQEEFNRSMPLFEDNSSFEENIEIMMELDNSPLSKSDEAESQDILIQFLIVFVHNAQALFRECSYPKVFNFLLAFQAGYFTYLFGKFYIRAYIHKKPQVTVVKAKDDEPQKNGKIKNGHVNGYANGHANGATNGYANGHVANGVSTNNNLANGKIPNDSSSLNGQISEGITGICHGTLPESKSLLSNGKHKTN